jgi:dimethylaniline monooxygenase (N-oxide forming)
LTLVDQFLEIPNLAFAGFNNGFMHLPIVELGMLWLLGTLKGIIKLPSKEEQLKEIDRVRQWKRENLLFERTRASCVGPRVFSYFHEILEDFGITSYRRTNPLFELLLPYAAKDWAGVREDVYKQFKKTN